MYPPDRSRAELPHATPLPTAATVARPALLTAPTQALTPGPVKLDVGALPHEAAMLEIMRAPAPEDAKAAALFGLLNQVPEEALASTAEQAVKWLRDRDYRQIGRPWIVNPRTHGAVLSTLMADLMERPDPVTLPTLVEIAQEPAHPLAPAARENLKLLVGKDHGVNWPAWDKAVLEKLSTPPPKP
jgi:hypothetical protein